jgi:hypothetical protein
LWSECVKSRFDIERNIVICFSSWQGKNIISWFSRCLWSATETLCKLKYCEGGFLVSIGLCCCDGRNEMWSAFFMCFNSCRFF